MKKVITKMEKQKKDESRWSIYIDGAFAFGVTDKIAKKYGLYEKMEFEPTQYEKLLKQMQFEKAKYRALDYLSRADRSTKQIKEKLIGLEYAESVVEEVIEFLKQYGYLNDEAFAKRYLEGQMKSKHKSYRKISYELYQKGIEFEKDDKNLIEEKEKENILYFLKKYQYTKELSPKEKNKMINRMINRGFSYGMVMGEIRKIDESFDM
jgi:regulatory protein